MDQQRLTQGDQVKINRTVLEGEILQVRYDQDTGVPAYLVTWDDLDDDQAFHERWFSANELTATGGRAAE